MIDRDTNENGTRRGGKLKVVGFTVLAVFLLLAGGLCGFYFAVTSPVIPTEQMQGHFEDARAYFNSPSPAQFQTGAEFTVLLSSIPEGIGDMALGSEEYEKAAREWLEESQDFLQKLRAFADREHGAIKLDIDRGPNLLMPWITQARDAAELLEIDIAQAVKKHDDKRILSDLKTMEWIARTVEFRSSLISRLVGRSIRGKMLNEIIECRSLFDKPTLRKLTGRLNDIDKELQPPHEALLSEIAMAEWFWKNKDMNIPERLRTAQVSRIVKLELEMIDAAEKPVPQAVRELDQIEDNMDFTDASFLTKMQNALIMMLAPACSRALTVFVDERAAVHGTRIVLALELYRRTHDTYPEQTAVLVPDYIPALPDDPYSGEDFKYSRRQEDFILYSIGSNLKDDGGEASENSDEEYGTTLVRDLDYVILRPPKKTDEDAVNTDAAPAKQQR